MQSAAYCGLFLMIFCTVSEIVRLGMISKGYFKHKFKDSLSKTAGSSKFSGFKPGSKTQIEANGSGFRENQMSMTEKSSKYSSTFEERIEILKLACSMQETLKNASMDSSISVEELLELHRQVFYRTFPYRGYKPGY